jgi:hypothetical protein
VVLAFDLASGWGVVIAAAVGLGSICGVVIYRHRLIRWVAPRDPAVSISHPTENRQTRAFGIGGSDADFQRQVAAWERARLSSLSVNYVIENHQGEPVREVTTGIRSEDGTEFTFETSNPILGAGDNLPVESARVPVELHSGMDDKNRAERFTFWARFKAEGRRWEANYDPRTRRLHHRRLRGKR